MVDPTGYSCPMPVIMVQKAVKSEKPDSLEVMVDNQCSVDNVIRFAQNQGYNVEVTPEGADFKLILTK